jgi:drug/metabolite transporter (DMT)-like permease
LDSTGAFFISTSATLLLISPTPFSSSIGLSIQVFSYCLFLGWLSVSKAPAFASVLPLVYAPLGWLIHYGDLRATQYCAILAFSAAGTIAFCKRLTAIGTTVAASTVVLAVVVMLHQAFQYASGGKDDDSRLFLAGAFFVLFIVLVLLELTGICVRTAESEDDKRPIRRSSLRIFLGQFPLVFIALGGR